MDDRKRQAWRRSALVAVIAACVMSAAPADAARARKCHGTISIGSQRSTVSNIRVLNRATCAEARKVARAIFHKYFEDVVEVAGYYCKRRYLGYEKGGRVTCRRPHRTIKFAYSSSRISVRDGAG